MKIEEFFRVKQRYRGLADPMKPNLSHHIILNLMLSLLPLLIYPGIIYKKVLHMAIKTNSDYICLIFIFLFQEPEIFLVVCCTFFFLNHCFI